MVVKALGSEWHSDCFSCNVSFIFLVCLVKANLFRTVAANLRMGDIFFEKTRSILFVSGVKKSDSKLNNSLFIHFDDFLVISKKRRNLGGTGCVNILDT